jgi:hypothetical protein
VENEGTSFAKATEVKGRREKEIKMFIFVMIAAFKNVFILQKKETS